MPSHFIFADARTSHAGVTLTLAAAVALLSGCSDGGGTGTLSRGTNNTVAGAGVGAGNSQSGSTVAPTSGAGSSRANAGVGSASAGDGAIGNSGNAGSTDIGAGGQGTANVGSGGVGNANGGGGKAGSGQAGSGNAGNAGGGTGGIPNGYWVSGSWHGSAWTAAAGTGSSISPKDFSTVKAGSSFCASGSVAPDAAWGGVGMLGYNLNQASTANAVAGTATPTGDGITIDVSNKGTSILRVQLQGPNGATDANDRWCAAVTGAGGFIPWSAFNTKCWDNTGSGYQKQPLASVMVVVPGSNTAATPFDFCVNLLAEHSGGGSGGSGGGGGGGSSGGGGSTAKGVVGYYGRLDCKNSHLQGAKTQSNAQVRGMSFFWSNWAHPLWREDMVDRMVDEFKGELIRLPIGVDNSGNPYDWGDEALVNRLVKRAVARDIYVLIDWHSSGAEANPGAAKDFFGRMAAAYGKLDHVMYEIYNEPVNQSWGQVKAYAEQVIPVIRAQSPNLIVVGSPHWSADVDVAAADPITSAGNLAYTLHFYAASHHAETRAKGDSAMSRGQCVFVTEWGTTDADGGNWAAGHGAVDYASTTDWLGWMDQHNISWANWSVMNKQESTSIFEPGTEDISGEGKYIRDLLIGYVKTNPWR